MFLAAFPVTNIRRTIFWVIEKSALFAKHSTHSDLIEVIDRRASLYKYVKFTQRSFDGDADRGAVIPIKLSSKLLQQSTKQFRPKLCDTVCNFGNLRNKCHRNYGLKYIDVNLAEVNRG